MKMAAFNAVCPYEIGDKITVAMAIPTAKAVNGQIFSAGIATITDIACTHYIKNGKIEFTYELDNSGQYAPLLDLRDAAKRD